MKRFLLGIFLGGCAWTDGKRREISIGWLCFWAVFGIFFFLERGRAASGMGIKNGMKILENIEASGGLAAGLFLLTASAVSKGKVGAGDGLAFLVSGLFLDFWENSLLLFESLLLLSAVCLESWIFQREAAPVEHPFMPYVFLVYLGGIIWNG